MSECEHNWVEIGKDKHLCTKCKDVAKPIDPKTLDILDRKYQRVIKVKTNDCCDNALERLVAKLKASLNADPFLEDTIGMVEFNQMALSCSREEAEHYTFKQNLFSINDIEEAIKAMT